MNLIARATAVLVPLVAMAGPAAANVTFTYTGEPLTVFNSNRQASDPEDFLSIFLTYNDAGTQLLDWSMGSKSFGTWSTATAGISGAVDLTTDSAGKVATWNVIFWSPFDSDEMFSHKGPAPGLQTDLIFGNDGGSHYYAIAQNVGTWSSSSALENAHLVYDVPEPESVAMMLAGLASLAMVAKYGRRKGGATWRRARAAPATAGEVRQME